MSARFHSLAVSAIERLTDDAVSVSFDVPAHEQDAFRYVPGQYLTLRSDIDGEAVRRTYSICSAPGEPLSVGVKRLEGGVFSGFVNDTLRPGDRIDVMPPDGRFRAPIDAGAARNYLLIAAGSGITPILCIARAVLEGEPESRVTLVYGNRTTRSVMFREAIEALKNRFLTRFRVLHVLSRESHDVDLFHGRIDADRVQLFADRGLIAPALADAVYLCGPFRMCDELTPRLRALGVDETRMHREIFVPADGAQIHVSSRTVREAVAHGARVEVLLDGARHGFTIESPQDSVLAAAAKAGLELPFSCAGGMCATCRCKLLEGAVEMRANYALQQWELDAGYVLACQSRTTAARLVLDFDAV